ncbi:unnamed protein product [Adineta ricciae]|uniref:Peptidase M13 N-terminal domain-containing protein n=1 Tax=Adineta ricciae TaxID=249248 RepID=A0A813QUM1_ADIRI|nr:unnamed protein product [Adineta ricciae]
MSHCCSWISRQPRCCRREPKQTYIYLYNPIMPETSTNRCCVPVILFGLCLAIVAIFAAAIIYHLDSASPISTLNATNCVDCYAIAMKRQLPDFVNTNIDPCEHFYEFVCDKLTPKKHVDVIDDVDDNEHKWTSVRHELHAKLMSKLDNQSLTTQDNRITSVYHLYQLCETQSPEILLNELENYFTNLSEKEPYKSYLTVFNQTNSTNLTSSVSIFHFPNPFFTVLSSAPNTSTIVRTNHRQLPSILSLFSNMTTINQTAFKYLTQFDDDYRTFLSEENNLINSYEQEYHQDSLISRRILTFSNYHQCLPSLVSNATNGRENLIKLLNHFLQTRLHNFKPESIDKQIRVIDKITDNHTLVEHLQSLTDDLKTIENITRTNNSEQSCTTNLLDQLLDRRIKSTELTSMINLDLFSQTTDSFLSNDWPFLFMLYERLLKTASIDTLANFAFFDQYRKLIYPYYQPYIQNNDNLRRNPDNSSSSYTYATNYPNLSCRIQSCFDILNCYHPSLLNQVINDHNQTIVNTTKVLIDNIIDRFRLLTEQSDNLYVNEKNLIRNQLNQIVIRIGHYSIPNDYFLSNISSSYLEYVQYLSSISPDEHQRSYYIEPSYYPSNHTLYLPFAFLSQSNISIEYHVSKLLLKILRIATETNPYHIDCSLKSYDDEPDANNTKKHLSDDESIVYLLLRSNFLTEKNIFLDEYLWPFMSASSHMKRFLIDYAASSYCRALHGKDLYRNNTYLIDDIHLIFRCQQANWIKQSKCSVI